MLHPIALACLLAPAGAAALATPAGAAEQVPDRALARADGGQHAGDAASAWPPGFQRVEELNALSGALVEKAATGSSPAHTFRVQARMYRELLRRLMLDNRSLAPDAQLPDDLLLEMVRMSALLHSAAECKTGFVIVCPVDLMRRLEAQQGEVEAHSRRAGLGAGPSTP